jgi:hypothetical protein
MTTPDMMPPQEDVLSAEGKTDAVNGEVVKNDGADTITVDNNVDKVKETVPEADNGGEADGDLAKESGEGSTNKNNSQAAPQACPEAHPAASNDSKSQSKEEDPKPQPKASSPPSKAGNAFVHDPDKITLRFLFAGRDGTHVIIDCKPNDTVGEVKGALMSCWPEGEFFFDLL